MEACQLRLTDTARCADLAGLPGPAMRRLLDRGDSGERCENGIAKCPFNTSVGGIHFAYDWR